MGMDNFKFGEKIEVNSADNNIDEPEKVELVKQSKFGELLESTENTAEKISKLEEIRKERMEIARGFLDSFKEKSIKIISLIKDLPESIQKMIKGELEISTANSIIQDSIPVWDLIKMPIENIQGETWDGHKLDRKSQLLRWSTITFRAMSMATTVLTAMEVIDQDAGGTLSNASLMMAYKAAGMVTYVGDQLRHNYEPIKEKFSKTAKFIETKESLRKWLGLEEATNNQE